MSKSIVEVIADLQSLRSSGGASEEEITAAENALGLKFAPDYRAYVAQYGVISARGIELSGVAPVARLNVVNMTMTERECGSDIASDMYVIENLGTEGIVAAQDQSGTVYWLAPGKQPEKAYGSLVEYILLFER